MATEIHVSCSLDNIGEEVRRKKNEISQKVRLARLSGLRALAEQESEATLRPVREELIQGILKPLSQEELNIWKNWLPTVYSTIPGHIHDLTRHWRGWENYVYDDVPFEVRSLIHTLRQNKVFEVLEIWTPEKVAADPALFGWIGDRCYLIARWGKEKLLTIDQLRKGLEAREKVERRNIGSGVLSIILGLISWIGTANGLAKPLGDVDTALFAGLFIGAITGVLCYPALTNLLNWKIRKKFSYAFENA